MSESNEIGPLESSVTWAQEFTVCRCEGPAPEPIALNGRPCCGRCHRPLVGAGADMHDGRPCTC